MIKLTKRDVQQRVLQDGKPLALSKFTWDGKTRTFSSTEDGLVIDFAGEANCTFKTGYGCTITAGYDCTITAGSNCTITAGYGCTITAGYDCTFNTWYDCTFTAGYGCTITAGSNCTITAGYGCTITAGYDCTITAGYDCVVVRRDEFEVIQPNDGEVIQLFPYGQEGYLINGMYNSKPHIIADGVVSEVLQKRGNIYKVKNLSEDKPSYLIKQGDVYSHGATLKEARDSLAYKIGDRDLSEYEGCTLKTKLSKAECIQMYRKVTGACESGTRYFVENNKDKVKDEFTIAEVIDLTQGQFGSDAFKQFMEGE